MKKINKLYLLSAAAAFICFADSAGAQIPMPFYCYPLPFCPTFGLSNNFTTVVNNGIETKDQIMQGVTWADSRKFGDLKAAKDNYGKGNEFKNKITENAEKSVEGTKTVKTCSNIDPEDIESVKAGVYKLFMEHPAVNEKDRNGYRQKSKEFYEDSLIEVYSAAINLEKKLAEIKPAIDELTGQLQNGTNGAQPGDDENGSWMNVYNAYDTFDKLTQILEEVSTLRAQYEASRAISEGLRPKDAIGPQSRSTLYHEEVIGFAQINTIVGASTADRSQTQSLNTSSAGTSTAVRSQTQGLSTSSAGAGAAVRSQVQGLNASLAGASTADRSQTQSLNTSSAGTSTAVRSQTQGLSTSSAGAGAAVQSQVQGLNASSSRAGAAVQSQASRSTGASASSASKLKKAAAPEAAVSFVKVEANLKSPYAGSEAELAAINALQPLYFDLVKAVEVHNLIKSLPDYRKIFEEYHNYERFHEAAMNAVRTADQCVIQHISRYYKTPETLWLGNNANAQDGLDYSLRGGLSKWAINSLEVAKAKETTIDSDNMGTMDSSGDFDLSTPSAEGDLLKPREDAPKGTVNPDKSNEIAGISRDSNKLTWRIGAEAAKLLTKDHYSASPKWGTVIKKYPIWTDQKRLYNQYLDGKYENVIDYVSNLDVRTEILEMALGLNTKDTTDADLRIESKEEIETFAAIVAPTIENDAGLMEEKAAGYDKIYAVREERVNALKQAEEQAKVALQALYDRKANLESQLKEKIKLLTEKNDSLSQITEDLNLEKNTAESQEGDIKEVNDRYGSMKGISFVTTDYSTESRQVKEEKVDRSESVKEDTGAATLKKYNPDEVLLDRNVGESQPSPAASAAPAAARTSSNLVPVSAASAPAASALSNRSVPASAGALANTPVSAARTLSNTSNMSAPVSATPVSATSASSNRSVPAAASVQPNTPASAARTLPNTSNTPASVSAPAAKAPAEKALEGEKLSPPASGGFRKSPIGSQSYLRTETVLRFAQAGDYGTVTVEFDTTKVDPVDPTVTEETKTETFTKQEDKTKTVVSDNIDTTEIDSAIADSKKREAEAAAESSKIRIEAKAVEGEIERIKNQIEEVGKDIERQAGLRIANLNAVDREYAQKIADVEKELQDLRDTIREIPELLTEIYNARAEGIRNYYGGQITKAEQEYSVLETTYDGVSTDAFYDEVLGTIKATYAAQNRAVNVATNKAGLVAALQNNYKLITDNLKSTYDAKIAEAHAKGDSVSAADLTAMKQSRLNAALANYNVKLAEAQKDHKVDPEDTEESTFPKNLDGVKKALFGERLGAIKARANSKLISVDNVAALIGKSQIASDAIKEHVKTVVERAKGKMFELKDNLYLSEGHPSVVSIHGELMDELQNLSFEEFAGMIPGLSPYAGNEFIMNTISTLFKKALLAKACAGDNCKKADEALFIGVVSKERDLMAPKRPMTSYLPPLREFIYFDKTDMKAFPQDAYGHVWAQDFLDLNDEIPEIWKALIGKDAYIEKDVDLEEILNTSVPNPPAWLPKEAAAFLPLWPVNTVEGFRFINGGMYPCRLGNYIIAISSSTGKYIVGSVSSGSIYPVCTQITVKKLNGDEFEIRDIAEDVADNAINNLGASDANLAALLNVGLMLDNNTAIESNSSELGTFLKVTENGMKLNDVPAAVFARLEVIRQAVEKEGSEYKTSLSDEMVNKAFFENNQIGNFLTFVDGELAVRKAKEELLISVEKTRAMLFEALKAVGFEPSPNLDLSVDADYDLVKSKLKGIKNNYVNKVSAMNAVQVAGNEIAEDKVKSMEIVRNALVKDNEELLSLNPTMRDEGNIDEQIATEKANRDAGDAYEKKADEEMSKRINGYPKPYCAAY